jgi:hypothetical protein
MPQVFWDVTPYGSCNNQRFEGMYRLHVVPSSLVLLILIMKAIRSSETSVVAGATRHHIPDDGILQILNEYKYILTNSLTFNPQAKYTD